MFGVPPNTLGIITLQHHHSKQLPVGLMVLSDGMVHFLKIKKFLTNQPKLSCGLKKKKKLL